MQTPKAKPANKGNAKTIKAKAAAGARKSRKQLLVVIAAIVIAAVIFTSLFYGLYDTGKASFSTFKHNFNTAKNVGIFLNYSNINASTELVACSSALIQELSGPTGAHRDSTTIGLFVLYNDSCIYRASGLGTAAQNYSTGTRQQCLNYSNAMPSIFIGYGATNETTITANRLYFIGTQKYISQCGIAYQIT